MKNVKGGGFAAYLRTMKNSLFKGGFNLQTFVIFLFAVLLFFALNQIRTGEKEEVIMLYNLFVSFLLFSGEWLRSAKDNKPELLTLYPATYKRKAVFGCLGILVAALSVFALVVAALFLLFALPALFVSCIIIDFGIVGSYLENLENLAVQFNAQGFAFLTFYALLVYGLALILSTLKKFNRRIVLCACTAVGSALMMTAFYFSVKDIGQTEWESAWSLFDKVPLSPLWIALVGVAAVTAIAFGFALSIKQAKPKQF